MKNQYNKTNKMTEYTYKGKKRPLKYITNCGNFFIENGDKLTFRGKYVWIDRIFNYPDNYHRHFCHISNLVPYSKFDHISSTEERIKFFINHVLEGTYKTPLEEDFENIGKIEKSLPKRDFVAASYNFTNTFRPCNEYKYNKDHNTYNGSNIDGTPAYNLAWYLYRNAMKILPEGKTECSAEEYEKIPYLY